MLRLISMKLKMSIRLRKAISANSTKSYIDLDHLSPKEKKQLVNDLRKHSNFQSGIPKIANVGEHRIKIKPGSQTKTSETLKNSRGT